MPLKPGLKKMHMMLILGVCCVFAMLDRMPRFQRLSRGKKPNVTVLLWHWPFGVPYNLEDDTCQKKYNISGCRLTDNRTLYSSAEIVVFHHYELNTGFETLPLHLPRPARQRWLWMSLEAPQNNGDLSRYAGIFNLIMSYHPGADVTIPYGKIQEKAASVPEEFVVPENKTHLACWVVSNYAKSHERSAVYRELRQHVPVQVYGRAVRKPLSREALLPTISRCYFYLAFENCGSPHYITEKLWRNAFAAGAIPVVLGPPRSHYEAVAPPHSFVHVDDFDSVAVLAKFLRELAGDEARYESYFAWHKKYAVKLYDDWRERLCHICQVYERLPYRKTNHTLDADRGILV